jgi:hypothetical protein
MALAISSIQTGSKTLAAASTSMTIEAGTDAGFDTAVVRANTLVIITVRTADATATVDSAECRYTLDSDGNTITVTRGASTGDLVCDFQIIEFSDGLVAQYLEVTMTGTTSATVAINDIPSGHGRFIISCGRSSTETAATRHSARWRLDSGTQASVNRSNGTGNVTACAIVVDVEGAVVRTIETTFTATTSLTEDEAIAAVTLARSSLYGTLQTAGGSALGNCWQMSFVDTETVRFTRADATSATQTVTAYAVEWPTGVAVQRVAAAFSGSDLTDDNTITAVAVARTMLSNAGTWLQSGGAPSVNGTLGRVLATLGLTSTTNLRLTKGIAATATAFEAQVVEFPEVVSGPTITVQPVADVGLINGDATRRTTVYTGTATGTTISAFTWEVGGTPIADGGIYDIVTTGIGTGSASSTLTIERTAKAGTPFNINFDVTDANGTTASNTVTDTWYDGPTIPATSGTTDGSGQDTITCASDYPNDVTPGEYQRLIRWEAARLKQHGVSPATQEGIERHERLEREFGPV